jgi:hypothetical protein
VHVRLLQLCVLLLLILMHVILLYYVISSPVDEISPNTSREAFSAHTM